MVEPNLGAFMRYLMAPSSRRSLQARQLLEQAESDYAVETDFWKRMRAAIVRDRQTTRDGQAVRQVADAATPKKQPSFRVVADTWPSIASRWTAAEYRQPSVGVVNIGGLRVAVRPLFAEVWPDGGTENVMVWMNQPVPNQSAVRGVMRLMTRIDPDTVTAATVVDARRGTTWSAHRDELLGEDEWLDRAGARFMKETE